MKLVVGLGNIGKEYSRNRHNLGFMVVDSLASKHNLSWQHHAKLFAETAHYGSGEDKVILAKPDTFMNRSGKAVQALASYYKVSPADVIVVSDDLDLEFGKARVRTDGSSGGQNGLLSIIETFGSAFTRLRLGIKGELRHQTPADHYVLSDFNSDEKAKLGTFIDLAASLIEDIIANGPNHVSSKT